MLIEFNLNSVGHWDYFFLLAQIEKWAQKNNIKHTWKRKGNILRVCFDEEKYYQWFSLSWSSEWTNFKIVEHRSN